VTVARALVGFACGFLLMASAVFVASGWRAGLGCLACAAVGLALGFDVDRVTRKSRWQENDHRRAAQALLEAANRVPSVSKGEVMVSLFGSLGPMSAWTVGPGIGGPHDPGLHNRLLDDRG
jgi:hypothetical protein